MNRSVDVSNRCGSKGPTQALAEGIDRIVGVPRFALAHFVQRKNRLEATERYESIQTQEFTAVKEAQSELEIEVVMRGRSGSRSHRIH